MKHELEFECGRRIHKRGIKVGHNFVRTNFRVMTMSSIRKEGTRITSEMDKIKMLKDRIFDYETTQKIAIGPI